MLRNVKAEPPSTAILSRGPLSAVLCFGRQFLYTWVTAPIEFEFHISSEYLFESRYPAISHDSKGRPCKAPRRDTCKRALYRLITVRRLSASLVYEVQPAAVGNPADDAISQAIADFDPGTVGGKWTQALDLLDTEPTRAITLARTLL